MELDEFSDDGLDDLPDNALQELENNAIQFTQAQHKPLTQARALEPQPDYSDYGWTEDDDLDTTEVTNDVGVPVGRPMVDKTLPQQQPSRPMAPVPNPRWNPVIDPAARSGAAVGPRPHFSNAGAVNQPMFGSQRFQPQSSGLNGPQASQFARPPLPQNRFGPSQAYQAQPGDIVSALQQRLRSLEAELNVARGEASIIRSNSTKAQQQHDAEVSRLKKLNAEQLAKQERMAEAAIAAEKSTSTELLFLQRDMKEVNDRARRRDGTAAPGPATTTLMTTPKKAAKSWTVADGFDDMDIVLSPSKGQGRGKATGSVAANVGERTPSKGKRKRPAMDSPILALETHSDDVVMNDDRVVHPVAQAAVVMAAPSPPFEYLQLLLDHGCFHQQPPTFDVFSRFTFPSDPTTSFATIIFQSLPLLGNPERPMQLLVDVSELIMGLWTRCLDEQLSEPIKYLVALISFTLQLHTTTVAPLIAVNLSSIAQRTIYTLAEGRHRLLDGDLSKDSNYSLLEQHINTTDVLSLLHTTALACATTTIETDAGFESKASDFWHLMTLDTVLLLLTPKQKLADIVGMLELLATSSLPGSIGPITEEKEPDFVAQVIIERVSAKLTEHPRSATTPEQKRRVRMAALRTLIAFARYAFGALQLALHNNALPRLVTCLSTSIDELYDQPIPPSILPPLSDDASSLLPEPSASSDLYHVISQCVLLMHTLVTDPRTANAADISQKLSTAHGGSQRYLISLGRLTFAEEDLVIEAGIDSEAVEAAHELLELAVTPDEGEIVSEAFGA